MNLKSLSLSLGLILSVIIAPIHASASPGYLGKAYSSRFSASPELRPRINFWINVFTRYGEHEAVVHHRDYPGIVFGSLSFVSEAQRMSPHGLEKFKKAQKTAFENKVMNSFRHLATGAQPRNSLEESIVAQMRFIPGGTAKYKRVVNERLVRSQTGIKERFADAIRRSGRYMPMLERIFREFRLPKELTRLPFVESSFDYKAYSSVGAAGIWQFMPRTAKVFGLKITPAVDERRDPVEAGRAAAKYLQTAYSELGTWPLALTSYNHGVGGVKRAVRKMGTSDINRMIEYHGKRAFGFASNNFYPEFLAALEVYDNYEKYFPGLEIESALSYDEIKLSNNFSVSYITKTLGLSIDSLKKLNYAISENAWKGRYPLPRGYVLKVPDGYGDRGSRLKMPEPVTAKKRTTSVRSKSSQPVREVAPSVGYHKVRKGDTLWSISRRFGVPVDTLKRLNGISGSNLQVGKVIKVSPN